MLKVQNVSLLFSDRKLFDDVNITFTLQETVMGLLVRMVPENQLS